MPDLALTEVLAWALVAAGFAFWALRSRGVAAAAVTATLAAIATKALLLDLV